MFAGWSPVGIAALVAIVGGVALLVAYAARRGLVHRELEGIEAPVDGVADPGPASPVPAPPSATRPSRGLGVAGALLLVVGVLLGVVAATGTWGASVSGGPGLAPAECAQTWEGCPKATP